MFGIKRPVKHEYEEGLKQISSLIQQAQKTVKIVEGSRDLGVLIEKTDFLEVCNRLKSQNKKVEVMTEQSNVVPKLQGYADILIAPSPPKWHFAIIGENYDKKTLFNENSLFIQKSHRKEAPVSKKPLLYCESEFFGEPEKYNDRFDYWAEKCERISYESANYN